MPSRILFFLLFLLAFGSSLSLSQPASYINHIQEGNNLLAVNELGDAKAAFEKALAVYQGSEARLGLARVEMLRERWKPAIRRLERALKKDSENMAIRYHLANAYRESVKGFNYIDSRYMPNNYENTWEKASNQYEWILARDSLYEDVLYQYALFWKYARKHIRAMDLAYEQVNLKPDRIDAQTGLIRLFDYLHSSAKRIDLESWMDARDSELISYLQGEIWRRQGELEKAEQRYNDLLSKAENLPVQLLQLSLARIHYARSDIEEGQRAIETAIQGIQNKRDAAHVFEEFKYIISPQELEEYQVLDAPEDFREFFRKFWLKRDPMPSRPINVRLAEHYRRFLIAEDEYIYRGFRVWHTNPDPIDKSGIPEMSKLSERFDDRGIIFIRYGEPDDELIVLARAGELAAFERSVDIGNPPPHISWRYQDPQMDFYFVQSELGSINWRLAPILSDDYSIRVRHEIWGGIYAEMASQVYQELTLEEMSDGGNESHRAVLALQKEELNVRMEVMAAQAVQRVMTTDRHAWPDSVEVIEYPYIVSSFNGEGGKTHVDIHYALPTGRLTALHEDPGEFIEVEVGCSMHNKRWEVIKEEAVVQKVKAQSNISAAGTGFCQFEVPPDSGYQIALHVIPIGTRGIGGYQFEYMVPGFQEGVLALSDILPALTVREATRPSVFNKNELYVRPNPFLRFSKQHDISLYFEIYNLTFNSEDVTRYTIEYELVQPQREGGILGIGKKKRETILSISSEHSDPSITPIHYPKVDVSAIDAGEYELVVRVIDLVSGASVEQQRAIEIIE